MPDPRARSEALAESIEQGGGERMAYGRGGATVYRSKVDVRVTHVIGETREGFYRFADDAVAPGLIPAKGETFTSIAKLAAAIVAYDDERNWQDAAPMVQAAEGVEQ